MKFLRKLCALCINLNSGWYINMQTNFSHLKVHIFLNKNIMFEKEKTWQTHKQNFVSFSAVMSMVIRINKKVFLTLMHFWQWKVVMRRWISLHENCILFELFFLWESILIWFWVVTTNSFPNKLNVATFFTFERLCHFTKKSRNEQLRRVSFLFTSCHVSVLCQH